jgi:hypothetical protein
MKTIILSLILAVGFAALELEDALAASGSSSRSGYSSSGRSTKIGPGTGSNPQSHDVRGTVRKDGTYVAPHRQSNPDKNFNNNWSTNPNTNPYTGEQGTRTSPPSK